MLKKERQEYFHIYAPFKNLKYGQPIKVAEHTYLFMPKVNIQLAGRTISPSATLHYVNAGIKTFKGFQLGPRIYSNAEEIQHTIDLLKGKIKPSLTAKIPMIVPKAYGGARKSYPMTDILETTKSHYIMKNGRALKKQNYDETKAEKDHPLLLINRDGSTIKENKWNSATLKTKAEKTELIEALEYLHEVLTTWDKVEVREEEKVLTLD